MTLRRRSRVVWEMLRALGPMLLIEIALRTRDLTATCRMLGIEADLDSAAPPAAAPAVLPRNTRAVARACRAVLEHWPGGDTCLRRCLLLGHRLRRWGPVLRIGVRRDADGAFAAHSWLEIGGAALDPTAADFAPLGATGR